MLTEGRIQINMVDKVKHNYPRPPLPPTHTHTPSLPDIRLFIPGPQGRQQEGEDRSWGERLRGQVLLHMPGATVGASHRGILLKVRRADLPITSA